MKLFSTNKINTFVGIMSKKDDFKKKIAVLIKYNDKYEIEISEILSFKSIPMKCVSFCKQTVIIIHYFVY